MYVCIYIYNCIYRLLVLTFLIKKFFETEFLTGAYSESSRASRMQLSGNGFERLTDF